MKSEDFNQMLIFSTLHSTFINCHAAYHTVDFSNRLIRSNKNKYVWGNKSENLK